MGAERPVDAVALAMDVARDRTADGDVLGARKDRQRPSAGYELPKEPAERHARLGDHLSALSVETEAGKGCEVEHASAVELGRVAVAAAFPSRERPAPVRREDCL